MKRAFQYVNDIHGNTQAVQIPLGECEEVLGRLKKYEQALKIRADLKEVYEQKINTPQSVGCAVVVMIS